MSNEDDLMIPFLLSVREHLSKSDHNIEQSILNKIQIACRALIYGTTIEFGPIKLAADKAIAREAKLEQKNVDEYTSAYSDIVTYLKDITQDNEGRLIRKIIVFIDDLDRCFPSKALRLLEGIKAFTDIQGFIFVLALDARVIESFVSKKYGELFGISGKEYIEKMFQVSFMLPKPSQQMLNDEVIKLTSLFPNEIALVLQESLLIVSLNIRQIKRILNFHEIITNIADPELPRDFLFVLQLVEYHWPNVFYFIRKYNVKFLHVIADLFSSDVDNVSDYLKNDNNKFNLNNETMLEISNLDFRIFYRNIVQKCFIGIKKDERQREIIVKKCIYLIGSYECN